MSALVLAASLATGLTLALLVLAVFRFTQGEDPAVRRLRAIKEGGRAQASVATVPLLRRRLSSFPLLDMLFARGQRISEIEQQLEKAGLQLRPSEYLALRVLFMFLFFLVALLFLRGSFPGFIVALLLGVVGYMVPRFYVRFLQARRLNRLEKQLPEALTAISNSLKAGFGFLQAMEAAARQLQPPIASEFEQALRDANLGASIEDALRAMVARVGSYDLDMVITAVLIQREVGGNLSEVLDNVAHTIRERERIRREVKTLTTMQRWEGYIAMAVPALLALLLMALNRDYMGVMFTEPMGRVLLGIAAAWQFVGFLITRRIVDIDI
ncbi:hypothetical protein HRbin25_00865 [bacterium HR25]|jgi:tight adherence protein B|nr:hypothetical protein HRbin25_00865 [bacterium HR25]